jgi:hypothetical protein
MSISIKRHKEIETTGQISYPFNSSRGTIPIPIGSAEEISFEIIANINNNRNIYCNFPLALIQDTTVVEISRGICYVDTSILHDFLFSKYWQVRTSPERAASTSNKPAQHPSRPHLQVVQRPWPMMVFSTFIAIPMERLEFAVSGSMECIHGGWSTSAPPRRSAAERSGTGQL